MKPIKLRLSGLTGTVYAITSYRQKGHLIEALTKQDVTADFQEVCCDYLAFLAEESNPEIEVGTGGKYLADGLDELVKRVNAKRDAPEAEALPASDVKREAVT